MIDPSYACDCSKCIGITLGRSCSNALRALRYGQRVVGWPVVLVSSVEQTCQTRPAYHMRPAELHDV